MKHRLFPTPCYLKEYCDKHPCTRPLIDCEKNFQEYISRNESSGSNDLDALNLSKNFQIACQNICSISTLSYYMLSNTWNYLAVADYIFPKISAIFHPTCAKKLAIHHKKVESNSPPLECRQAFVTVSAKGTWQSNTMWVLKPDPKRWYRFHLACWNTCPGGPELP